MQLDTHENLTDLTMEQVTQARNGAQPGANANASLYPWSQRRITYTTAHTSPFPRYGAAVNSVSSKEGDVYMMGGLINSSTVKGDLWIIEAGGSMSCYPLATTAEGPGPRVGHSSLLVGNAFIVYGGDTKIDESDILDETLYLLNTCKPPGRRTRKPSPADSFSSDKAMVSGTPIWPPPCWPLRSLTEHSGIQDLYFRWPG